MLSLTFFRSFSACFFCHCFYPSPTPSQLLLLLLSCSCFYLLQLSSYPCPALSPSRLLPHSYPAPAPFPTSVLFLLCSSSYPASALFLLLPCSCTPLPRFQPCTCPNPATPLLHHHQHLTTCISIRECVRTSVIHKLYQLLKMEL